MSTQTSNSTNSLTQTGRYLIVISAFLGWFFAGMHLGTTSLAMGSAAKDLLQNSGFYEVIDADRAIALKQIEQENEGEVEELAKASAENRLKTDSSKWFGYYVCALLFGGAAGGLVFGRLGDRFGRVKGMTAAICCYSGMSLVAYFVQSPGQLLIVRFIVCMGVGGMWPNGVALMSEAWANVSRPLLAGVIGTAANIGIFFIASIGKYVREVTVDDWRWVMLLGGAPIVFGLLVPFFVPESPRWLIQKEGRESDSETSRVGTADIFKPGMLAVTLIGILLATVPLFGSWGSSNWAVKWAEDAGSDGLKAQVIMWRSLPGIVGSFLGGWVASFVGRRRSYLLNSLICLASAQCMFWFSSPTEPGIFLIWTGILGFFSGIFFGWLPLFLPELFVTRVRSVGAGVCFNFGRIITALTVFITAGLIAYFDNDFRQIGRITSLIYLCGAIGILLMPKGVEGTIKD
ncbi:MAG: MFS transporter [Verrucomicrobiota bacterium]|nr:MFS transporter [Verrucomicrobiota bacterium]